MVELQNALAEKSSQLENAETKIQELMDDVSKLGRELEIGRKLLDESQVLLTENLNFDVLFTILAPGGSGKGLGPQVICSYFVQ